MSRIFSIRIKKNDSPDEIHRKIDRMREKIESYQKESTKEIELAKWIDKIGENLAVSQSEKFRLTADNHWEFKTRDGWWRAPDHYKIGLIMILGGVIGYKNSDSNLGKVLSVIAASIGTYLVLDDFKDFKRDIRNFLERINS